MTSPNLDARLNVHSPRIISVFRIIVGLLFALHGSMILFGWPLPMPMQTHVGDWPGWWAGLHRIRDGTTGDGRIVRPPAAFVASGQMAVAYFWQHWPFNEGEKVFWPFDKQMGGNGGELAILFCFSFLLILFIGPGPYAVDRRGARRRLCYLLHHTGPRPPGAQVC